MNAVNDNEISGEQIMAASGDVIEKLDWVRPVFVAMKAANIPDSVAQRAMGYLLECLDTHLNAGAA